MRSPLLWTFVAAAVLLLAVGGWLLTDPATSHSDALKTGGLAGGAVVALYALWLNDRRRKVEEARQEVERDRHTLELSRAELDRERVGDERFAKSVELLGHEADQVRVGALHALAGLARSRESYRQTVLDVLCSYLRRPFTHPHSGEEEPVAKKKSVDAAADRERQVRLTAQRLIGDLLPSHKAVDAPAYKLDLTGAELEYFDLSERTIGELVMRYVSLHSSTNLSKCRILGPAYFTGAGTGHRRLGYFRCEETTFSDRAWFSGTMFHEDAVFRGTTFAGRTTFKNAVFAKEAVFVDAVRKDFFDLRNTRFEGFADLRFAGPPDSGALNNTTVALAKKPLLPPGWQLKELGERTARIVPGRG
ncbi:pentapeptide repeat-containing protein [Amycolatopsis sp. NPDC059021]|uniref:pentapeptide repeat-containing protein n=1 Tax=Amycolatopsis sp. NPDC059021 TaxID=3346704 RepID=UPI0036709AE0